MDLDFNPFELVAVAVSVLIANSISSDGKSNWLEGTLLLAAYTVLGFAFYFYPVIPGRVQVLATIDILLHERSLSSLTEGDRFCFG